jgi:anaerobic ribonucleoside-triphosphate reductase activating protein
MTEGNQTLRISRVHYPVTALGHGTRLGIWVQGCPLACRGCIARDTWAPEAGFDVSVAELARLWREAVADGADGLTISGGEPLAQPLGLAALLAAMDNVRIGLTRPGGSAADRELDILVYTGYEEAELGGPQRAAIRHADVLITGRFDITAPTGLIWRGSDNQEMLPRTALGRKRYARYVNHVPEQAPMQVTVDEAGIWFIGVPRDGDMPRLERALRQRGVGVGAASWRTARPGPRASPSLPIVERPPPIAPTQPGQQSYRGDGDGAPRDLR